jgi:hypothetical protein
MIMVDSPTGYAAICRHAQGVSEESEGMEQLLRKISEGCREPASYAWRDALLQELEETAVACSSAGWDGYDAEPVKSEAYSGSSLLIQLLPEGIIPPRVVPEPDGDLALEWILEGDKHFTLSLSGDSIIYAGILGKSRKYGREPFQGELPPSPLGILTSTFSKA